MWIIGTMLRTPGMEWNGYIMTLLWVPGMEWGQNDNTVDSWNGMGT